MHGVLSWGGVCCVQIGGPLQVLDPDLCLGTEYVDSGRSSPTGRSRTCTSRSGHAAADSVGLRQLGEDLTYVLPPGVFLTQA